jgi:hypothetical protein
MKTVLWLLLLTLAAPATANEVLKLFTPTPVAVVLKVGEWLTRDRETVYYIQVEGVAATEAEARTQAFRLAVEQAVGSLLLTETAVKNGEVQRHEIINYSSGYIRDFEYVSKKSGSWGTSLVVDVWVAGSKIADRLGVRARSTGDLAGGKIAESLASIQQQNDSGDAVVLAVLTDFPERAFSVKVNRVEWKLENRQPMLQVEFHTWWNKQYLDALEQAMQTVGDVIVPFPESLQKSLDPGYNNRPYRHEGPGVIFDRQPCLFCSDRIYTTDPIRAQLLVDQVSERSPFVLMVVYDSMRNPVFQQCLNWEHISKQFGKPTKLFGTARYRTGSNLTLHTKNVVPSELYIDVKNLDVSNMDSVELAVVRKSHCPG